MNACVIDGGLSTALEEAGHSLDDRLWTARLLIDDPEAIVTAHLAFLRAGARVLISSSYQASEAGFVAAGLEPDAAVEALRSTTALAVEARARFALEDPTGARDVLVAASVGPYGATLGDGSEYRAPTLDDLSLVDFHTERLRVLIDTERDVLAIETISSTRETHAIVSALNALTPTAITEGQVTAAATASSIGSPPQVAAVSRHVNVTQARSGGKTLSAPTIA